jgi:hypothetical protein
MGTGSSSQQYDSLEDVREQAWEHYDNHLMVIFWRMKASLKTELMAKDERAIPQVFATEKTHLTWFTDVKQTSNNIQKMTTNCSNINPTD